MADVDETISPSVEEKDGSKDEEESKQPTMSKSQMKRKRRYEKLMEYKKKKKQQERDARAAKAKAAGRDLDAERKFMEERTANGEGKKRRQELWERTKLPLAKSSFEVCVDCSFESEMTFKEVNSLASQIRYCYSFNKGSPCFFSATSVGGQTLEKLKNVSGFEEWSNRACTVTGKGFDDYYAGRMDTVVYLTSDSETTLDKLENNKVYIIGGIVDRNRLKGATLARANSLGVATAKLPIEQYLKKFQATRVLTCNHVFEILLRYRDNGGDWQKALLDVLPKRKDVEGLDLEGQQNDSKPETSES